MEAIALSLPLPPQLPRMPRPERLVTVVGLPSLARSADYVAQAAYLVRKACPEARFEVALGATPTNQGLLRLASRSHVLVVESLPPHVDPALLLRLPPTLPLVVSRQVDPRHVPHQALRVDMWDPRRMADAILRQLAATSVRQAAPGVSTALHS